MRRLWLSVYAVMFNYFPLGCNNYDTNLFIYIATSHPSERGNVSSAIVDLAIVLILKEVQYSGHVLLLLSESLKLNIA